MARTDASRRRCAIYTRKSSEEGLEQEFNSLAAQREACEAYIRSQQHEGWVLVRTRYDDGGFSGGNLERPALQHLIADIRAGRISIVVVYKVDRLTRSLADFARLVEIFDAQGASFVSVTQQFNTTSSMGRLTLNVLLSFAQFEREVTGERIRDKIAASKKKGIWMGGNVPLGYDADERTLVINPAEAETVRRIFGLYCEYGCVRRVKDEAYPGQHPALIDDETWIAVQDQLATNAGDLRRKRRAAEPSLLAGLLVDAHGERLTPSHAVKKGRRYRYYVSATLITEAETDRSQGWRLAAQEIEGCVISILVDALTSPARLLERLHTSGMPGDMIRTLLGRAARFATRLRTLPEERAKIVRELVEQVILDGKGIIIKMRCSALLGGEVPLRASEEPSGSTIELTAAVDFKRRGAAIKLVLPGLAQQNPASRCDPALIKAIVRGRAWFEELATGRARSLQDLANRDGITRRYIRRLVDLAFLSPQLVEAIMQGRQSVALTATRLTELDLPLDWSEQHRLLAN